MPNSNNTPINGNKNTRNLIFRPRPDLQSVSNDVFSDSNENDSDFTLVKSKPKRNLSVTSTGQTTEKIKKSKSIFASSNRYNELNIDDTVSNNTGSNHNLSDMILDTELPKPKPPPPIFVRGVSDYLTLRAQLIELLGVNNFSVKSSTRDLKIQTTDPDSYRALIKYLKDRKADFHTYQAHEDKPFRIAIRNIHPSTPTSEIGIAIEDIGGFSVRNVANVINKINKKKLPIFFVDLEPAEINKDIFSIKFLLNTKIKIEEPYKKRSVVQCIKCQEYGHSKSYCAHAPRCVKCAANHPTSSCTKDKDQPPVCALCQGNHTANYRGCQVHKEFQRLHFGKTKTNYNAQISKPSVSYSQIVNNGGVSSSETQRDPLNINDNSSFPNLTHHPPNQHHLKDNQNIPPNNPTPHSEIASQLSSFINEFKLILNPLISLLTTVITKLM